MLFVVRWRLSFAVGDGWLLFVGACCSLVVGCVALCCSLCVARCMLFV